MRRYTTRIEDGRVLAVSEWGPPEGRPVLFCTGAGMSGYLGFGQEFLAKLNLRLVAIDRPGLGGSTPDPSKTLSTWVEDIRRFLDATSNVAAGPLAVGFSQGAPFALALAARGMAEAVAVVSGQDELSHPELAPLLHPDVRDLVEAVAKSPAAVEQHFRDVGGPDVLMDFIMRSSSPRDAAFYRQPEFHEAFRRALEEGFSQGSAGYARDLINALQPWPFRAEDIRVPVHLWYGEQDTSTVHSPDFGATLARRLPNAARVVDPAEGGSILWTRARDILSALSTSSRVPPP